ncbi:MAG TPA: hypothetical protein VME23_17265 [Terracidiphilus sp.]|nr:hypothetical protein [Terracidiphilus sp.]
MNLSAEENRPAGYSTRPGYVNHRGQVVIRNTGLPGTDRGQAVYQLGCSTCGHVYGANGSDIHLRRCPMHDRGAPGLRYEEGIFEPNRARAH